MIITCEACGTSFKIKTSLIKETGSTVRCSKCQQVFVAYPQSPEDTKSTDFSTDESLEAKIEDVLGSEFDDDFRDLESEISLETADISMSASEETAASRGLFATADSALDDLETGHAEPEIMMSELEQDDNIISLDSLVSGSTADEELDLGALLKEEDEDESDIMSFTDLGSKSTAEDDSEILSFGDLDQGEEEVSFGSLESTADQDEDTVGLEDLESDEWEEEEEILTEETIEETREDEEEDIDFLDFEDEEVQQEEESVTEIEEKLTAAAEPEEIMEGGVDTDLDEFDLEKESEEEDTSEGTEKDAGKLEEEAEKPAKEALKSETEEEEFDLDFELDLEETSKAAEAEEDFELDLDSDADTEVAADVSIEEDDLGLDLEGFEDLDLTEASSGEAAVEEDLGLDLESTSEMEEDLGLDLDLDEFEDLDLADASSDAIATEEDLEFDIDSTSEEADEDLGLDMDEFDNLDLDLEEEAAESAAATAEEEDFDLDFDLDEAVDEKAGAEEETFELDLNIEPEPEDVEAESEEFDLDLDFDDDLKDVSSAETFIDEDDASATKAEEFDLTQIEDVLDFDETPEPEEVKAATAIDDLEMDLDEMEPDTVSDEDEMSIDLETMLDEAEESAGEKKEVSLETVEERDEQIKQEYKKTVIEERETPEKIREEVSETEEADFDQGFTEPVPVAPVGKERNLKKILIPLILLILLGAAIFIGMTMFAGKEDVPVAPPAVTDQGNLQIEMSANPAYKFVENETAGEILVITGNVVNRYDHPRSNIVVKGTLYDNAGTVISTSTAYSGNMFSDSELSTLEMESINERLNNRTGDDNLNADIAAGQKIPFTVVFSNLPEDMYEFTTEVVQSAR